MVSIEARDASPRMSIVRFFVGFVALLVCVTTVAAQIGTWRSRRPVPRVIQEAAAAAVGGKVYVVGGYGAFCVESNEVDIYDPTTDTWDHGAPMPTPRRGLAVVELEGKIYAIGGATDCACFDTVEVYDPPTDTWASRSSLPTCRYEYAAAALNGKIYAFAGIRFGSEDRRVYEYDPATDSWSQKADCPFRIVQVAVPLGNRILIAGVDSNAVLAYDPATDSYEARASMITGGGGGRGYTAAGGKAYVMGGGHGLTAMEIYDPNSDTWLLAPPMPTGRTILEAASARGRIYAIGGVNETGQLDVNEEFSPVLTVRIDVKPGSDPNSISLSSAGVVPVAVLSSSDFDASTIDPETITLAGARVKMVGKSNRFLCSQEDVNLDGLLDLVCQIETVQFMIEPGDSMVVLEGQTFDGQFIRGEDSVRIVPE